MIPAYNAAATLARQLDALAGQDCRREWEVVVVDNGSRDATAAIARRYVEHPAATWRSLRVVDGSGRRGISAALNAGARASCGELLLFADADDVVTAGWVTAMVDAARRSDLIGGYNDLDALNGATARSWRRPWPTDRLPRDCGLLPYAVGGNFGVWRDVLEAVGGWDESYRVGCTDVTFCWRAQLAGYRLTFVPDAVVNYQLRASLRELAYQQYRFGLSLAQLFRDFRSLGMPRPPLWKAVRAWAWAVLTLPLATVSRRHRGKWVLNVAYRAGNLVGSARFRVLVM